MNLSLKQKQLQANLLLLFAAAVWGFAFVAQVKASESNIGPFLYNGIRYLIGAIVLIPILLIAERKQITACSVKKTSVSALICGTVMMAAVNLQQFGIDCNMNAGKSGFITGLYIVFIPITGIFLGKKVGKFVWIAVVSALVGLFLISFPNGFSGFNQSELLGDLLILGSAFLWTAQILCVDKYAKKCSPILFSILQFLACGIISMIAALIFEEISINIISAALLPILYGGLVSVGIGYTLQVVGQRHASPAVASIAMAGESIFATIGGALLLDEKMSLIQYAGAFLMFSAILTAGPLI